MTEKTSESLSFCCHLLGGEQGVCRGLRGCQAYCLVTREVSISALKRTRISKSKLYENVHQGFVHLSSKLEITHTSFSRGRIKNVLLYSYALHSKQGTNCWCVGHWVTSTNVRQEEPGTECMSHDSVSVESQNVQKSLVVNVRMGGPSGRPHCTGPQPLLWCDCSVPCTRRLQGCTHMDEFIELFSWLTMAPFCLGVTTACLQHVCRASQ